MDYAALAQQFGGTSAPAPAAPPPVDYVKLAQQFGGTSSAAKGQPSAADIAAADPTAGMGTIQRFVAGYGKAGSDLVRGVGQHIGQVIGPKATAVLGLPTQADIDESRKLDAPLMGTRSGEVGNVTGNIAAGIGSMAAGGAGVMQLAEVAPSIAALIPASSSATGAALAGGAFGAAQPTATGDSTKVLGVDVKSPVAANALAGAGLGAAGVGAGKALSAAVPIVADYGQSAAQRLMQSALKPTIAQLRSGEAQTAVNTLLKYGFNATDSGVNKLKSAIYDINNQVSNAVNSSSATVSKGNVVNALQDVRTKFGNQVSPTGDLAAIDGVQQDFLNHPMAVGDDIPVQQAQALKQGTYQVLKGKFGEVGSADTEAQKALARGLKNEIATAVPEVGPLNAEESNLLTTLSVTERRALMDANKNPGGLALLAHNPVGWAAFMADKSAAFKSYAARLLNSASGGLTPAVEEAGTAANAVPSNSLLQVLNANTVPGALVGQARRSASASMNQNSRNP